MLQAVSLNNDILTRQKEYTKLTSFVLPELNFGILDEINQYKSQIGDKFESCTANTASAVAFKASDGKNYNLHNIMNERLYQVRKEINNKFEKEQEYSWFSKAANWFKNTFNLGYNHKRARYLLNEADKSFYENRQNFNAVFENLVGEEYSAQNIERFLKGELKLKAETYCEKYIDKNLSVAEFSIPTFDENWKSTLIKPKMTPIELSKEEQEKYNTILETLDEEYKNKLAAILNSGELLKNNSNDSSSVLDNLYNILKNPRIEGVDNLNILKECLDILENPCVITQIAEDIPDPYKNQAVDILTNKSKNNEKREQAKEQLESRFLSTCASASIEYDLVESNPAEFFRLVEGLTSEEGKAKKIFVLEKDSSEYSELLTKLESFKTPYEETDNGIEITLNTGKNTGFLAAIQNNNKDENERSIIDIIMQSTIMNLGSMQTYDALSDTRTSNEWCMDNSGLVQQEVLYTNNILNNKSDSPNNYMRIINKKIVQNDIFAKKKDIYKALSKNQNCIVGYVFIDPETNTVTGGHEITIIGYTKNLAGKGLFVCQDSDDGSNAPICISEESLLKNIDHISI